MSCWSSRRGVREGNFILRWSPYAVPHSHRTAGPQSVGPPAAALHAPHQRIADAIGPDAQGVRRDAEPDRQLTTPFDFLTTALAVSTDDQLALVGPQFLETAIQTFKLLLALGGTGIQLGRPESVHVREVGGPGLVEVHMLPIAPNVLEQDEPRDHVAVAGRWPGHDDAATLQGPADAIQCFVCQFLGRSAITPIEIRDETSPHLQVAIAV